MKQKFSRLEREVMIGLIEFQQDKATDWKIRLLPWQKLWYERMRDPSKYIMGKP